MSFRVLLFHNILWSHYKGVIFSRLNSQAPLSGIEVSFVQIAETEGNRKTLSGVDLSFHNYPYTLLFKGALDDTSVLSRAWRLVREVWRSKADIVVLPGYDDPAYWALWLACLVLRKGMVLTLDSTQLDHRRQWYKEAVKCLFVSQCDAAFCYGIRSAEYLAALGMAQSRILQRCQAAPRERLAEAAAAASTASLPAELGLEPRRFFLFVGRLSPEKGLDALLDAFAAFVARNPGFKLCLIGGGAEEAVLRARCAALQLEEAVVFAGSRRVEELVTYYRDAYALVLPSLSEPWGLVVNEAFQMGCPALVSDHCGCLPDLVFEGRTGFQFRAGDVADLQLAMERMLAAAPQREQMGDQCRMVIERFSPDNAASQMIYGLRFVAACRFRAT